MMIHEMKGAAHERFPHPFIRFGDALTRHSSFFVPEVEGQTCAGCEEEKTGLPGEGAETVARFGFLDGALSGGYGSGGEGAEGLLFDAVSRCFGQSGSGWGDALFAEARRGGAEGVE